ncbi:tRNA (uracil-5-)-methyltransferase [Falsiroseomonas bella]|uniref:tRNA (Uracil-5-)-methyltransferase n=1 Tax=Falsiroseomonas bella TaxID=2184016 RepID=A0A317FF72_9PROT|nr:RsmD family RNA methyltransferase [Falsiroseomonas bella]PWS37754.1 tRNA (uracil-5-)-methyltransferase [Falsiroseomonas bella]
MSAAARRFAVARLGSAGDGVADTPDGPLHIPRALPGESVTARPAGRGQAVLDTVEAPSPERVAPPCAHFLEGCGGCALQHWDLAAQARWKRERLIEALARAGFAEAPVAETVATPTDSRRRADLALRRAQDGSVAIGFHARGSAEVLDLRECHILEPALFALLAPLRVVLRRLSALAREGSAVVNLLDSGPDILLRTDKALDAAGRRLLAAAAQQLGVPRIAWAQGENLHETAAQTGPVRLMLGAVEVAPPPGAFLQASREGEAAIVAAVLAGLPTKLPARPKLLDLYAGIGTLSFPLAKRGRVTAAEGSAEAVAALDAAARKAVARVEAVKRDLARQPYLPAELKAYDVVVLDPPYAGAAEQVAQIARSAVRHLVYVSCNPVALARDAAVLRGAGFGLVSATPVDQFRWSAHLESVVSFSR